MEHRSSTRTRHLTLFCAVLFASFHVRCFPSSSAILVRRQVCWGLPLFRFPCGFHSSALLATCPSGLLNSSLMVLTFRHSWVQHSFPCSYPHPPTRVPPHYTYSQNTNTISLHLFYHLSTLTSLKQYPYIPLPNTLLATAISSAVYASFSASRVAPTGCYQIVPLLPYGAQWHLQFRFL